MLIPPVQSRGGDLGHWRGRAGGPLTRGLAGMRRAAGGNIVIMASEWGVTGWPEATAYSARRNYRWAPTIGK